MRKAVRVQNGRVTEANGQLGVLARVVGSRLRTVREIAGLSHEEAAARLGCEADWLARVEAGFTVAGPEEVERILVKYGARGASSADVIIEMARRAATPPPWLAPHASRISAADRDLILVEAQATLAQVHGFRLVPYLVQTRDYYRGFAPGASLGHDVDQEWDLLSCRQAHRPADATRLLDVIIDETAFDVRMKQPQGMAGQIRYLLSLADSPHATVRVIPRDAAFWEERRFNFDVLSFAGTTDRIGVAYSALGAHLAPGDDLYKAWTLVEDNVAADPAHSRAILERHLAALT
jgi:transcriptional regulator with XRE-family HTH domain